MKSPFEIIGYSGHSYVVLNSVQELNMHCIGYYDTESKESNPFQIKYLGSENLKTSNHPIFITIGDNHIRKKISDKLYSFNTISILDNTSSISNLATISNQLVYVGKFSVINPLANIEKGVIINTSAVIEHEVHVQEFSHIGPNATICGGCKIGKNVFIGAGAVIKQNIAIGDNTIVGAGAVVIEDLNENSIYAGNPAKLIRTL